MLTKYETDSIVSIVFSRTQYVRVAQLVERDLAKVEAAGSSPVSRFLYTRNYQMVSGFLLTNIRRKFMKLFYEFGIILFVTFLGEALHAVLPLPIPASIYGLLLMLLALCTRLVKLERVKRASDFLISIMPPMFIPAAVGLVAVWGELSRVLVPVSVITVLTTVLVMAVTGRTAQAVIRRKKRGGK